MDLKANTATFKGMVVRDGDAICLMVAWWQLEINRMGSLAVPGNGVVSGLSAGVSNGSNELWNELDRMDGMVT